MLRTQAWRYHFSSHEKLLWRGSERESDYTQVCNIGAGKLEHQRLLWSKENQISVKEFSILLCMERCESMGIIEAIPFICISAIWGQHPAQRYFSLLNFLKTCSSHWIAIITDDYKIPCSSCRNLSTCQHGSETHIWRGRIMDSCDISYPPIMAGTGFVSHCNGILLSCRKNEIMPKCSNVDGPRDCCTEWSSSDRERGISYAIAFLKALSGAHSAIFPPKTYRFPLYFNLCYLN